MNLSVDNSEDEELEVNVLLHEAEVRENLIRRIALPHCFNISGDYKSVVSTVFLVNPMRINSCVKCVWEILLEHERENRIIEYRFHASNLLFNGWRGKFPFFNRRPVCRRE